MLCLNFYKFNCDFKTEKSKICFHLSYNYKVKIEKKTIQNIN